MENSKDLTKGPIAQKLILYFLPILAGNLFHQLYNAVDAVVVGKYVGTAALAAVGGSAANIINVFIGFFVTMANGASVVIAQQYGAGDKRGISRAVHTAVIFCVIIGICLTLVLMPYVEGILTMLKAPADTVAQAASYLRIIFIGTTFQIMYNMCSGILRASGDSRRPFWYLCVSCLTNIVLDITFVVVFHWGVQGVAVATVLSQAFSCILVLHNMFTEDTPHKLSVKQMKMDFMQLRHMLRIGIPAGFQGSMYSISNMLIVVAVNSLGTAVVASWALSGKVDGLFWSASNAAGAAIMNFIAQNYGAGDIKRVRQCVKIAFKMFAAMTLVLCIIIILLGQYAVGIFTDDPEVMVITKDILLYFASFYLIWTVVEIYSSALRGAGDAFVPTLILGVGICASRIIWINTAFVLKPTVFVLALCYPVSWTIAGIPLLIRYRNDKWNKLKAREE